MGLDSCPRGDDSEEWAWIDGWVGRYSVSTHGRVASHRPGWVRLFSPSRATKYGHQKVVLAFGPARERQWVHRLVISTFGGPAPTPDAIVRHLDGNAENNRLENLAWGTAQENNQDRAKHGTSKGELNPGAILKEAQVLDIFARKTRGGAKALAEEYGCTVWAIYGIWRGDSWGWLTGA